MIPGTAPVYDGRSLFLVAGSSKLTQNDSLFAVTRTTHSTTWLQWWADKFMNPFDRNEAFYDDYTPKITHLSGIIDVTEDSANGGVQVFHLGKSRANIIESHASSDYEKKISYGHDGNKLPLYAIIVIFLLV